MSIWALKLKKHITAPLDEIILSLDQFGKEINLFACVNFIFKSTFKIFLWQLKVSKFHTNIFRGPKINRSFNIDLSTVKLYLQDSEKRQFRIFDRFVRQFVGYIVGRRSFEIWSPLEKSIDSLNVSDNQMSWAALLWSINILSTRPCLWQTLARLS